MYTKASPRSASQPAMTGMQAQGSLPHYTHRHKSASATTIPLYAYHAFSGLPLGVTRRSNQPAQLGNRHVSHSRSSTSAGRHCLRRGPYPRDRLTDSAAAIVAFFAPCSDSVLMSSAEIDREPHSDRRPRSPTRMRHAHRAACGAAHVATPVRRERYFRERRAERALAWGSRGDNLIPLVRGPRAAEPGVSRLRVQL